MPGPRRRQLRTATQTYVELGFGKRSPPSTSDSGNSAYSLTDFRHTRHDAVSSPTVLHVPPVDAAGQLRSRMGSLQLARHVVVQLRLRVRVRRVRPSSIGIRPGQTPGSLRRLREKKRCRLLRLMAVERSRRGKGSTGPGGPSFSRSRRPFRGDAPARRPIDDSHFTSLHVGTTPPSVGRCCPAEKVDTPMTVLLHALRILEPVDSSKRMRAHPIAIVTSVLQPRCAQALSYRSK